MTAETEVHLIAAAGVDLVAGSVTEITISVIVVTHRTMKMRGETMPIDSIMHLRHAGEIDLARDQEARQMKAAVEIVDSNALVNATNRPSPLQCPRAILRIRPIGKGSKKNDKLVWPVYDKK